MGDETGVDLDLGVSLRWNRAEVDGLESEAN